MAHRQLGGSCQPSLEAQSCHPPFWETESKNRLSGFTRMFSLNRPFMDFLYDTLTNIQTQARPRGDTTLGLLPSVSDLKQAFRLLRAKTNSRADHLNDQLSRLLLRP